MPSHKRRRRVISHVESPSRYQVAGHTALEDVRTVEDSIIGKSYPVRPKALLRLRGHMPNVPTQPARAELRNNGNRNRYRAGKEFHADRSVNYLPLTPSPAAVNGPMLLRVARDRCQVRSKTRPLTPVENCAI
jgi:hypothetical protein